MDITIYTRSDAASARMLFNRPGMPFTETVVVVPDGWTYLPFGEDALLLSKGEPNKVLIAASVLTLAKAGLDGFRLKDTAVSDPPPS